MTASPSSTFPPTKEAFRALVARAFTEVLPSLGFPFRQAQLDYALQVADEILMPPRATAEKAKVAGTRANVGLIEASTGIGKTVAYLVVVGLLCALARTAGLSWRALLATHTLVLQNQIVGCLLATGQQPSWSEGDRSDLAIMIKIVGRLTGVTLTAAYRKGRQAYVDPARARAVLKKLPEDDAAQDLLTWIDTFPTMPEEDASDAEKAAFQVARGKDPRQGQLQAWLDDGNVLPRGILASDLVMSDGSASEANPWYAFAREESRDRDIVVVTHAMVLVDIMAGGKVLSACGTSPAQDFTIIIHDEADMLPGVAENFSRHKVRPGTVRHLLDDAKSLFAKPVDVDAMGSPLVVARDALLEALNGARDFLTSVYNDIVADGRFQEGQDKERLLTPSEKVVDDAVRYATPIIQAAKTLAGLVDKNRDAMPTKAQRRARALVLALREAERDLSVFVRVLTPAMAPKTAKDDSENAQGTHQRDPADDRMTALSWSPKRALASFEVIQIDPGRLFSANWTRASAHRYVLLTSATLRVPSGGKTDEWTYIKNALNAHAAVCPQDYAPDRFGTIDRICLAALLGDGDDARGPFLKNTVSEDALDDEGAPYNPRWQDLALFGARQMAATGQQGLLLTPSYRDVMWLAEHLEEDSRFWLHRKGTPLSDGVKALQEGRAQILVTPAAWAGHNIRALDGAQMLRHVGILRLPYPPQDSSLLACLESMFTRRGQEEPGKKASGVMQIRMRALALHKFIQGVGRGIRAPDDVMTLWVFDPRFGVPKSVVDCGDPRLVALGLKAVPNGGLWHRALPARFRSLVSNPERVTLLVSRVVDGVYREEVITPQPGIPTDDFIL